MLTCGNSVDAVLFQNIRLPHVESSQIPSSTPFVRLPVGKWKKIERKSKTENNIGKLMRCYQIQFENNSRNSDIFDVCRPMHGQLIKLKIIRAIFGRRLRLSFSVELFCYLILYISRALYVRFNLYFAPFFQSCVSSRWRWLWQWWWWWWWLITCIADRFCYFLFAFLFFV